VYPRCEDVLIGCWRYGAVHLDWQDGPWQPEVAVRARIEAHWATACARPGVHLFDGPLARFIAAAVADDGSLILRVQPTSYRMFLGTNGRSPGPGADQQLANPLGTSAVVVTADNRLLLGRRSARVALHPGRLHPFGGCIEVGERDVFASIARELHEELGVVATELALAALVREPDLRQPELIFVARVAASEAALRATLDPAEHSDLWSTAAEAPADDADLTPIARAAVAAWLRLRATLHPAGA
jgi:8-oxo-dGTP pyrophosphatase MutT (NUDIX family)